MLATLADDAPRTVIPHPRAAVSAPSTASLDDMQMRRLIPSALVPLALFLTGCSGLGQDSTLREALEQMPGANGERFAVSYGSPAEVHAILGYTPTPGPAGDDVSARDQWGHFAVNAMVPPNVVGPLGVPIIAPGEAADWIVSGMTASGQFTIGAGIDAAAARQRLAAAGAQTTDEVTFTRGPDAPLAMERKHVVFADDQVTLRPDSFEETGLTLAEDTGVEALLECLNGAEMAYLTRHEGTRTYAIAASVDEDAEGSAWACVHAPDEDGQAVAEEFAGPRPAAQPPRTVGETSVDGDVVRFELLMEPIPADVKAPAPEAGLIFSGPESTAPFF